MWRVASTLLVRSRQPARLNPLQWRSGPRTRFTAPPAWNVRYESTLVDAFGDDERQPRDPLRRLTREEEEEREIEILLKAGLITEDDIDRGDHEEEEDEVFEYTPPPPDPYNGRYPRLSDLTFQEEQEGDLERRLDRSELTLAELDFLRDAEAIQMVKDMDQELRAEAKWEREAAMIERRGGKPPPKPKSMLEAKMNMQAEGVDSDPLRRGMQRQLLASIQAATDKEERKMRRIRALEYETGEPTDGGEEEAHGIMLLEKEMRERMVLFSRGIEAPPPVLVPEVKDTIWNLHAGEPEYWTAARLSQMFGKKKMHIEAILKLKKREADRIAANKKVYDDAMYHTLEAVQGTLATEDYDPFDLHEFDETNYDYEEGEKVRSPTGRPQFPWEWEEGVKEQTDAEQYGVDELDFVVFREGDKNPLSLEQQEEYEWHTVAVEEGRDIEDPYDFGDFLDGRASIGVDLDFPHQLFPWEHRAAGGYQWIENPEWLEFAPNPKQSTSRITEEVHKAFEPPEKEPRDLEQELADLEEDSGSDDDFNPNEIPDGLPDKTIRGMRYLKTKGEHDPTFLGIVPFGGEYDDRIRLAQSSGGPFYGFEDEGVHQHRLGLAYLRRRHKEFDGNLPKERPYWANRTGKVYRGHQLRRSPKPDLLLVDTSGTPEKGRMIVSKRSGLVRQANWDERYRAHYKPTPKSKRMPSDNPKVEQILVPRHDGDERVMDLQELERLRAKDRPEDFPDARISFLKDRLRPVPDDPFERPVPDLPDEEVEDMLLTDVPNDPDVQRRFREKGSEVLAELKQSGTDMSLAGIVKQYRSAGLDIDDVERDSGMTLKALATFFGEDADAARAVRADPERRQAIEAERRRYLRDPVFEGVGDPAGAHNEGARERWRREQELLDSVLAAEGSQAIPSDHVTVSAGTLEGEPLGTVEGSRAEWEAVDEDAARKEIEDMLVELEKYDDEERQMDLSRIDRIFDYDPAVFGGTQEDIEYIRNATRRRRDPDWNMDEATSVRDFATLPGEGPAFRLFDDEDDLSDGMSDGEGGEHERSDWSADEGEGSDAERP